jgi:hypothetical protein
MQSLDQRTILRSQSHLLNSNSPARLISGLGTRHQKTRKFPRSGQNCSESKIPENVQLQVRIVQLTEEALLVCILKVVGVMSCGFLLGLGLSNVASSADKLNTGQSDK